MKQSLTCQVPNAISVYNNTGNLKLGSGHPVFYLLYIVLGHLSV